jgi:hypothetical protein
MNLLAYTGRLSIYPSESSKLAILPISVNEGDALAKVKKDAARRFGRAA